MRILSNETLLKNVRKAYKNGTLLMMQPTANDCLYTVTINGKECGCAIGVSLNKEEKQEILNKNCNIHSIMYLIEDKIVDFEDEAFAREMQHLHDNMLNHRERQHWRQHNYDVFVKRYIENVSPA